MCSPVIKKYVMTVSPAEAVDPLNQHLPFRRESHERSQRSRRPLFHTPPAGRHAHIAAVAPNTSTSVYKRTYIYIFFTRYVHTSSLFPINTSDKVACKPSLFFICTCPEGACGSPPPGRHISYFRKKKDTHSHISHGPAYLWPVCLSAPLFFSPVGAHKHPLLAFCAHLGPLQGIRQGIRRPHTLPLNIRRPHSSGCRHRLHGRR